MTKEELTTQLENNGYSNIQIEDLSLSHTQQDANGDPFYERDRLLHVFRGRLKGCLANDPNSEMIPFLQEAISNLESIASEEPIYYWECLSAGNRIVGRSTVERVLHIYPKNSA